MKGKRHDSFITDPERYWPVEYLVDPERYALFVCGACGREWKVSGSFDFERVAHLCWTATMARKSA